MDMLYEPTPIRSPELTYSVADDDDDYMTLPPTPRPYSFHDSEVNVKRPMPLVSEHLIFVIHGIGQQTEKYGMFHQHMRSLRDTLTHVLQARQPHQPVRVELVPIEWHRHIHKETDPAIQSVMPKSIPTVRLLESDYVADALFYFSKDRSQSIIDHCTRTFNSEYHDFLDRRPGFSGKVAILGYSLGGMIAWDILSHQRQNLTDAEMKQFDKFDIKVPKLGFKPDYLFGMGCPAPVLLAARNQDPRLYHPDDSVHFENIYHPSDPLAFRMEPLFNSDYAAIRPVVVDRAIPTTSFLSSWPGRSLFSFFTGKSSQEPQQSLLAASLSTLMQLFSWKRSEKYNDDIADTVIPDIQYRRASEGDISSIKAQHRSAIRTRTRSNSLPSGKHHAAHIDGAIVPPMVVDSSTWTVRGCFSPPNTGAMTPDFGLDQRLCRQAANLPGGRRCDFELMADSFMGMISNEYILGLTAHFSYWTNKDMLWHIFCRMEQY